MTDYCTYVDVVSLYPFAMQQDYPTGVPIRHEVADDDLLILLNDKQSHETDTRRIYRVDVSCPRDVMTAFLLERDKQGKLIHDLSDKIDKTYVGVELREAVRIGYRITRVYEYMEWKCTKPIYKEYILRIFEMKKQAKIEGNKTKYNTAKFLMNALSGKMGQKPIMSSIEICPTDVKLENIDTIEDVVIVQAPDGEKLGLIVQRTNPGAKPTKPVYLAAFILAYARQYMSELTRGFEGYDRPEHAFLYTDTDSFVLRNETKNILQACRPDVFGTALGQLEDELSGGRIIRATFLAPKTYCLEFVTKDTRELKTIVRCKGVPHASNAMSEDELVRGINQDEVEIFQRIREARSCTNLQQVALGVTFYCLVPVGKQLGDDDTLEVHYPIEMRLSQTIFRRVLAGEINVVAMFGGMRVSLMPNHLNQFPCSVRMVGTRRHLSVKSWWSDVAHRVRDEHGVWRPAL